MRLFQYEQFFSKHKDPEVRKMGKFLIGVIDQLEAALLITSNWSNWKVFKGRTRMDHLRVLAALHAIDRHDGNKAKAAKWLGITRQSVYNAIDEWNKQPSPKHENKTPSASSPAPNPNSLPDNS